MIGILRITALVGAAALLSTAAHASTVLATSGNWSAVYVSPSVNPPGCMVTSRRPSDGSMISIGVSAADNRLRVVFRKASWRIPPGTNANVFMSIDGHNWNMNGSFVPNNSDGTSLATYINQNYYRTFYNQLIGSDTLTVRFSGNEPPWIYSLWGIRDLYQPWLNCVRHVVPAFLQAASPTQPYSSSPTQPYDAPQLYRNNATQPF